MNRTTEVVPQEAQRQGVTEELDTIAGVNSLRGLTAWYHCGRRLNVWYLCFEPLRAMNSLRGLTAWYHCGRRLNVWYLCFEPLRALTHCVVSLRGTTAGVGSMCGITALNHCGRELLDRFWVDFRWILNGFGVHPGPGWTLRDSGRIHLEMLGVF